VHRYPLHTSAAVVEESTDDDAAPASLVLGHTSLLTTLLLSPDEKYLLTADRDEHVRVSWFPQAFIIEAFCLGHTKYLPTAHFFFRILTQRRFVSAIHIPPSSPDHLISGGGDPELRVWEWRTGRALAKLPVRDAVIPHIAVIPSREKRPILRKDGKPAGRKGRKKAQQAAAAQAVSKEAEADKNTDKMDADDVEEGTSADVPSTAPTDAPPEPVLVVQRIATISDGSADTTVVFSTTGFVPSLFYAFPSCRPSIQRDSALYRSIRADGVWTSQCDATRRACTRLCALWCTRMGTSRCSAWIHWRAVRQTSAVIRRRGRPHLSCMHASISRHRDSSGKILQLRPCWSR
jgi:tRNA (guanine-N(7)-)-methyltransferase subunit TRM82